MSSMNNFEKSAYTNLEQTYEEVMDYLFLQYHDYAYEAGDDENFSSEGSEMAYYGGSVGNYGYGDQPGGEIPVGKMVL